MTIEQMIAHYRHMIEVFEEHQKISERMADEDPNWYPYHIEPARIFRSLAGLCRDVVKDLEELT